MTPAGRSLTCSVQLFYEVHMVGWLHPSFGAPELTRIKLRQLFACIRLWTTVIQEDAVFVLRTQLCDCRFFSRVVQSWVSSADSLVQLITTATVWTKWWKSLISCTRQQAAKPHYYDITAWNIS